MVIKKLDFIKQTHDLKSKILKDTNQLTADELRLTLQFVDFLEKALILNPEKRLTIEDASNHAFIKGNIASIVL